MLDYTSYFFCKLELIEHFLFICSFHFAIKSKESEPKIFFLSLIKH